MAKKGGRRVVDARADSDGDIKQVKLDGSSHFIPVKQAIRMADRGELSNAHAVHPRSRNPYLRTNPDGRKGNNLDEMAGDHKNNR
jgi:hypothetical protein